MRIGIVLILFFSAVLSIAQTTFSVRDAETGERLIGATAMVKGGDGKEDRLVSRITGNYLKSQCKPDIGE